MKVRLPTAQEKRALEGETNVAALLHALDERVSGKTTLVIVGRASYQIGNDDFAPKLRQLLGEEDKIDDETGKLYLTEDIDCFHTDASQEVIDAAHEHSYLNESSPKPHTTLSWPARFTRPSKANLSPRPWPWPSKNVVVASNCLTSSRRPWPT